MEHREYQIRVKLLRDWAAKLNVVATHGGPFGGHPVLIQHIDLIAGPRAGALEIILGDISAGRMLKSLAANDMATHRQLIPWRFPGEPGIFMTGPALRLEAPWPDNLAEKDIPLSSLGANPHQNNQQNRLRWIVGKNELGHTVTMRLSDTLAHLMIGGQTGGGKTVAMRSALGQIARNAPDAVGAPRFILIDAKYGAGLGALAHIPNQIGPMAVDADGATRALAWALGTMKQRLITKPQMTARDWEEVAPILLAIDEIQEVTQLDINVQLLRQLAAQGREAKIHIMAGTQHPVIDAFGDSSVKRNLTTGVIALRTADAKSSEVIVGASEPRADRLLGRGDSYIVTPGQVHRTQIAYLTESEIGAIPSTAPDLAEWPEFEIEGFGAGLSGPPIQYEPGEVALALINAREGAGRDRLKDRFVAAGRKMPGSPKAGRLRDYGRQILSALEEDGWSVTSQNPPPA